MKKIQFCANHPFNTQSMSILAISMLFLVSSAYYNNAFGQHPRNNTQVQTTFLYGILTYSNLLTAQMHFFVALQYDLFLNVHLLTDFMQFSNKQVYKFSSRTLAYVHSLFLSNLSIKIPGPTFFFSSFLQNIHGQMHTSIKRFSFFCLQALMLNTLHQISSF